MNFHFCIPSFQEGLVKVILNIICYACTQRLWLFAIGAPIITFNYNI